MQPYTTAFLRKQAQQTAQTRQFFYQQVKWDKAPISIDLGCGTGAISPELSTQIPGNSTIGLDINTHLLNTAVKQNKGNTSLHFLLCDAQTLPLRSSIANFVLSHFTLMWIKDRQQAVAEVYRILQSKGVLAAIEPDYRGRIEVHDELDSDAKSSYPIINALEKLGADPFTGSHLPVELKNIGFSRTQCGVLAWEYQAASIREEIKGEARLLRNLGIYWITPRVIYTPIWWSLATKD